MPVNTTHASYDAMLSKWQKCQDCYDGEDQVKEQGELYLPKLGGQEDAEYSAYKMRASFYNGTKRTVEGILGAIFRKDPVVETGDNDTISAIVRNMTNTGVSLPGLAKQICRGELKSGRGGLLVDIGDTMPFASFYKETSIINWKTAYVGGIKILTMVVLAETYETEKDEFESETGNQYRVLSLKDGAYSVRIYREKDDEFILFEEKTPEMRGQALPFIPFVFFGIESNDSDIDNPPLLDLVNVNLSLYRNSADYEHGLHWTALPTPWTAGFGMSEDGSSMVIGSEAAWSAAAPDARCGFLEFSGAGIGSIRDAMEDKKNQMATLGARLLEEPKDTNESGVAIRLRLSGESGVIQSMARAVSEGLTKALKWMAAWSGVVPDSVIEKIAVTLNQELFEENIDPNQLQAVVAAWQSGMIGKETAYFNAQKMGVARPGVTFEDEQLSIDGNTPTEEM